MLVFDSVVDQYYKPNRTLMTNWRDVVNEFLAANDWAHFHFKTALSRLLFGCLLSQSIAPSPTQSSCLDLVTQGAHDGALNVGDVAISFHKWYSALSETKLKV